MGDFVTKHIHFVITNWHLTHWAEITRAVYQDFEAELVECNGEANHVHLLVNFPPKMAASKLVNPPQEHVLPQARQEYPVLVRHNWRHNDCGPARTSPGPWTRYAAPRSAS
ncbi:transposase [Streptomyces sp. NBC_01017]|uniref:transposase n=1 Tax=Streptomyces sp. NBC_01017 TaxID=2903721 RepID=UPI0038663E03|nr:transposase [Streptomyces sp. NBC_01017]